MQGEIRNEYKILAGKPQKGEITCETKAQMGR
jgi:hypothetical protein